MPPKEHRQYEQGSFEANFHEIADPIIMRLQDEITLLTDRVNKQRRIISELEIREKKQSSEIRLINREVLELQRLINPNVQGRLLGKSKSMTHKQVIQHLREKFENTTTISKLVLLAGGAFTATNLRNYLGEHFGSTYTNASSVSQKKISSALKAAGLNNVLEEHNLVNSKGESQRVSFYRIKLKGT